MEEEKGCKHVDVSMTWNLCPHHFNEIDIEYNDVLLSWDLARQHFDKLVIISIDVSMI